MAKDYNYAINELKAEKQARERLQNELVEKDKQILKMTEMNTKLKTELESSIEREKQTATRYQQLVGQKTQQSKPKKCCWCNADSKFRLKEKLFCSYKCAKESTK